MGNKDIDPKNKYQAKVMLNLRRKCAECGRWTTHSSIRQGDQEIITCRKCGHATTEE